MDIDRFIARNQDDWERLRVLTARARRRVSRLEPGELEELVALYQRASAHLSHARVAYRDPALTARLTRLVSDASGVIYGKRPRTTRAITTFFADTFPAAVWTCRRAIAASAALMFVPALIVGVWLANSERALDVAVPKDQQELLLQSEFEDYYSSVPAAEFSAQVLVHNIEVSILAFALGILFCVGTAVVLFQNGLNIGIAAGLFVSAGQAGKFFGLVLPHGLLELTAITIAGGAGIRLGWTVIDPGDRTRADALSDEGRRSVVLVIGLMLAFVTAGLIEGFVTPSGLPTWARVGIGVAVEVVFLSWVIVRGRAATARGVNGLIGERRPTWDTLAPAADEPTDVALAEPGLFPTAVPSPSL
jgi:uncharacterized membrane protein SpoIIM required for sporulation